MDHLGTANRIQNYSGAVEIQRQQCLSSCLAVTWVITVRLDVLIHIFLLDGLVLFFLDFGLDLLILCILRGPAALPLGRGRLGRGIGCVGGTREICILCLDLQSANSMAQSGNSNT